LKYIFDYIYFRIVFAETDFMKNIKRNHQQWLFEKLEKEFGVNSDDDSDGDDFPTGSPNEHDVAPEYPAKACKTVTWVEDPALCVVKYFICNPEERSKSYIHHKYVGPLLYLLLYENIKKNSVLFSPFSTLKNSCTPTYVLCR